MKTELNSVDVRFIARELDFLLKSARVDKIYQTGGRELKVRFKTRDGMRELIAAPSFLCLTNYVRESPESPSSFAMQLRKHLGGSFVKEVRQQGFDRIIEFKLSRGEAEYTFIAELFSKGNFFLCDSSLKILGLLEWQKWRDRVLGVNQIYSPPPKTPNPFEIDPQKFRLVLSQSDKNIVRTMASNIGLSGFYAEEACLESGLNKAVDAKSLAESDVDSLYKTIENFRRKVDSETAEYTSHIVLNEQNEPIDVLPFESLAYKNNSKRFYSSFNEAVDEYFSKIEKNTDDGKAEEAFKKELEKLEQVKKQQEETIKRLEIETQEYKRIGDLIYQNYALIENISKDVRDARKKGLTDEEITDRIKTGKEKGVKEANHIKKIKGSELTLDI